MAKGQLTSMVLNDLKKAEKKLGKAVAPKINYLFRESVYQSLTDWYMDYHPRYYDRTLNFYSVGKTAATTGLGNMITMQADSSLMHDYPGFDDPPYEGYERKPYFADTAFDFMFINGEHGHGNWMMKKTTPSPYWRVDRDIQTGFGGLAQEIINDEIGRLLFG